MKISNFILLIALSLAPIVTVTEQEATNGQPLARLEIGGATVGKPTQIRWLFSDPRTGKKVATRLSLTITQLEKGIQIFSISKIPTDGDFTMNFHFTDGSAHQLRSIAQEEGRRPIIEERVITVTTLEPPPKAILSALFFFLAVIALGLVTGRISRRRAGG